ncbi:unnamed protein product [Rotaria socialis]|uniref:Transposase n=1 Tax=Rotaria socialis TaxID=392032 RepID=A0A821TJY0_9BILA|nr:unnamed protein product [Rotaria socialis]
MRGVGFQNLVKILVEVGQFASKSKFEVTDILSHPTTISKNISRLHDKYKLQLINICEKLTSYCIIVDQWTETHTALRYVTDDFQLFTFILGCFPYNAASHSTQHLCEFVNKVLAEYNPVLGTTKFVVTDNEAKMLAAFREQCCRIGCADHYLNKQSQHAFQSEKKHSNRSTFEAGGCELAQTVFGHVKKIVSFVRHSHKQQKLPRELQNYSETRFAGAIIMVDIFREMYQNLPEVLINSNAMENYNAIEKDLLDDICNFLEPFQDVINALSKDRQLCLHQKLTNQPQSSNSYQEIENYLNTDYSDIPHNDDDLDDIDILSFWQEHRHTFSQLAKLAKLAKIICAMPASNTIVERLFSAAKNRTVSISSTATVSSEESTCTAPKLTCIDVEEEKLKKNLPLSNTPDQGRKKASTPIDDRNSLRLCKKYRTKSSQILSSELMLSNGKHLSARTVRRRLLDMSYKSYQAKKKPLRTFAHKKQRFLFAREHQYWSQEWNNII